MLLTADVTDPDLQTVLSDVAKQSEDSFTEADLLHKALLAELQQEQIKTHQAELEKSEALARKQQAEKVLSLANQVSR